MTNSEKIKQILLSEIEKMNQHREDFCRHPGTDFTRDRKISFDTLLHFQISMESGSVNHELLNKVYTDAVIQPIRKRNEFAALYGRIDRHTPYNGTVPIFIADRGFHAYNVFAHAVENRAFFVIRATDAKMKRLPGADLPKEEIFDIRVTRHLTKSHSKKNCLHPESADQYWHICQKVAFDHFPTEGYGEYEISLRVLRFPIGSGIYENIITNLPENEFHAEEIKERYHLRWGIEPSFCTLKHTIAAVNFHAKSRQMITHGIWARLILFNFCSYITEQVKFKKQKRKHIHQVDFSIAFKTCRHFLRLHSGEEAPDRNFARQQRFQVPVSFTYRF